MTLRPILICLALVFAFSGGAVAKTKFDAQNADRVDGRHAVGATTSPAQRKGKLVATNGKGRLPGNIILRARDSLRLGGFTHAQTSAMSFPPQGAGVSGTAMSSPFGVNLAADTAGELRLGFVIPPDHDPEAPLLVDMVYAESSLGACEWFASASGLEGPDSPTGDDLHNGGWFLPGTESFDGMVSVPAGEGRVHTATFEWPFQDNPGMFVQFALARIGAGAADTCGSIQVYGLQLRY